MTGAIPTVTLAGALLLLAACAADSARVPQVTRTDSAGIAIVTAGAADAALGWEIERIADIDPERSGAGVIDVWPGAVRSDSAGRIYALDAGAARIVVFDADGRFVRAQGRKGGGPGEVEHPIALTVAPDGTASMFDIGKGRLVRFGPHGEVLDELQLRGFFGGGVHAAGDVVLFDARGFDQARQSGYTELRRVQGGDAGSALARSNEPPGRPITLKSCGMSFSSMPPLFVPSLRWDASGARIALVDAAAYDVRILERGREVRRLRREVAPRAATAELAAREVGDAMEVRVEGGVRRCDSGEVAEARGYAARIPAIDAVALAPGGEVWVERGGVTGEELPIDVFAADGAYLGTLPAGTPFPAAFLSGDRFIAVEKDEDDVARIVIYRIRRER